MKKIEMEELLKKMEGFTVTIHNDYEENGKTTEEKLKSVIETVELILFRLGGDDRARDVFLWICDSCIIALHEAGISYCGYEANNGASADYDISRIYDKIIKEDF